MIERKEAHSGTLPACRSFDISQMRALFWSQSARFFGFGRKTPLRRPTAHAHQSSCWRRSDREMAWGFERGCLQRLFYLSSSESSKGLRRSEPNTSQFHARISTSSNRIVSNNSITSFLVHRLAIQSHSLAPLFPRHLDNAFRDQNSILTDVTKVGFFLSGLKTYPVTSTFL